MLTQIPYFELMANANAVGSRVKVKKVNRQLHRVLMLYSSVSRCLLFKSF